MKGGGDLAGPNSVKLCLWGLVHVLPWVCCVALPCCLFDLACFLLSSFSSLIKTCTYSMYLRLILSNVLLVCAMPFVYVIFLSLFKNNFKNVSNPLQLFLICRV